MSWMINREMEAAKGELSYQKWKETYKEEMDWRKIATSLDRAMNALSRLQGDFVHREDSREIKSSLRLMEIYFENLETMVIRKLESMGFESLPEGEYREMLTKQLTKLWGQE